MSESSAGEGRIDFCFKQGSRNLGDDSDFLFLELNKLFKVDRTGLNLAVLWLRANPFAAPLGIGFNDVQISAF